MNKNYRSVWNASSGEWVAAPEFARGRGRSALRNTVLACVSLLSTAVWAACTGGGAGQTSTPMVASAGSACAVDPSLATVAVPAGNVILQANGAGSTWTVDHDVALSSGYFFSNVSQRWGVAATAGGQVLLNGSRSSVETNAFSTAHGISSTGAGSLIQVAGDLTVTINGGGNANAATATRGILAQTGGVVEVLGHATVNTTNSLWPAGANNRAVSAENGTIRLSTATLDTRGPGAMGILASGAAAQVSATGLVGVTTAGANAPGLSVWSGGQLALSAVDVRTTGNASAAISNANGGGAISIAGGALRTTGSASPGIQQSLGTVQSTDALTIDTFGAGSTGISVSGTGVTTLGQVRVTTSLGDAHGMLVTGAGAKVSYVDGTFNSGGHGVYAVDGGRIASTGNTVINVGAEFGAMARGAGSSLSFNNVTVTHTTPAFSSNGVAAYAGGVVNVTGATDITSGTDAYISSVYARGDNSVVRLGSSTSIQHQGNSLGGAGLATQYGAGTITAAGPVTITTQGAPGIYADPTGTITLQDINVAVGSNGNPSPHGVFANGAGANISYTKGTLNTTGTGLLAEGGGVISASGDTTIVATGAAADGIRVGANSRITAAGAMNIAATGAGTGVCSSGVAVCLVGDNATVTAGHVASASRIQSATTTVRMEAGANMVATLDNASLTTTGASSDLLSVSGATGSSALNLRNSTATASAGGLLLNVASGSTFAFDNDNTVLTGDIKASADSTVNMALHNGSRLTGKIDPVNLNIDATSRWDMTGDSLLANLGNAGTINVLPGAGGVAGTYKTLTATNYVGNGGRINLNTYLGDDSSPSDKLVVDGGSATGSTRLGITNAGGSGALTTGNGILVVDAQNGATTATGAFALAGAVSAGAYDYSLVRRANQNWYLSSELITVPPVDPGTPLNPDTPGVTPPATPPAALPNYRQETSLYAAVPSLAILHSAATMDSFHERVGAAGPAAGAGDQPSRLWLRVLGNTGERKGDALGVYGRTGPAFDHKSYALQLGGDLYRGANANGSQTAAGVYLATGQTTGDVMHFNGAAAGGVKLDVSSLGMYWTLLGPAGGYVDFVAQGNHYGVTATSTRMPTLKTSGSGYDVSVEGGLPFQLSGPWSVEPQLQLRLLSADIGHGHDIAGRVHYGDAESLVGRAGVKLAYKGSRLTAWTRLDLLNEFKGRSRTQVASLWGTNGVDFNSSVHGAAVALTAGVDAKLTDRVSLYGSASYRRALGDNRGHAWGAQAGVKVAW